MEIPSNPDDDPLGMHSDGSLMCLMSRSSRVQAIINIEKDPWIFYSVSRTKGAVKKGSQGTR